MGVLEAWLFRDPRPCQADNQAILTLTEGNSSAFLKRLLTGDWKLGDPRSLQKSSLVNDEFTVVTYRCVGNTDSPITCRSLLRVRAATLPKSPTPVVYTSVVYTFLSEERGPVRMSLTPP